MQKREETAESSRLLPKDQVQAAAAKEGTSFLGLFLHSDSLNYLANSQWPCTIIERRRMCLKRCEVQCFAEQFSGSHAGGMVLYNPMA